MWIMDFANDDDFNTAWKSNSTVKQPWYEVELDKKRSFNMITIVEQEAHIKKYRIEYRDNNVWKPLLSSGNIKRTKIHRFTQVSGDRVRILIDAFDASPSIAEFGVYAEKR